MQRKNILWTTAVLAALTTGVLVAPTGAGAAPRTGGGSTDGSATAVTPSSTASAASTSAVLDYWTPARMAAATPMVKTLPGAPTGAGPAASAATGAPQAVSGRLPSGAPAPSGGFIASGSGATAVTFSYPFPFARFTVYPKSVWKTYPYKVNGKVFFTQNGGNFVCSGTSVVAPSGNRVWTAGHCVNNGAGVWSTNVVFVPSYNGSATTLSAQRPFGTWVANFSTQTTTTAWNDPNNTDFSRDLGAFSVNRNANGNTLSQVVGNDGFAWNQARDQQYVDFGYPQASPFNGKSMTECLGATATYDTGIGGSGPAPQGIGCDMTGGSSGGAWNMGFSGNGPGWINGHNDYKYGSQPLAMYSPYFDTLANTVRCQTETGC